MASCFHSNQEREKPDTTDGYSEPITVDVDHLLNDSDTLETCCLWRRRKQPTSVLTAIGEGETDWAGEMCRCSQWKWKCVHLHSCFYPKPLTLLGQSPLEQFRDLESTTSQASSMLARFLNR